MEWSRPTQQGEIPTPRAGHAGVTVGENWFIVGGGDNKSGMQPTNSIFGYIMIEMWFNIMEHSLIELT